jgi:hypothetical protein
MSLRHLEDERGHQKRLELEGGRLMLRFFWRLFVLFCAAWVIVALIGLVFGAPS